MGILDSNDWCVVRRYNLDSQHNRYEREFETRVIRNLLNTALRSRMFTNFRIITEHYTMASTKELKAVVFGATGAVGERLRP